MALVPSVQQLTGLGFRSLNRLVLPLVRTGVASPLPIGLGLVAVEVPGRSSGILRTTPLVSARLGDRLLVSTVRQDSQWVRNLEAAPTSEVWVCGQRRRATASVRRGRLQTVVLETVVLETSTPQSGGSAAGE